MFAEDRQKKICEIVNQRNTVKVSELSDVLDTSEVTIRRDLEELQRQKRIIRTHGGAMSTYNVGKPINFTQLISRECSEKHQIAMAAYDMIEDDDTILLDTSSTVNELINVIASGSKKNIRIITTSLVALEALRNAKHCAVQIVGGEINFDWKTVEGSAACRFIRDIRVDKTFIGINGIDENFGFSTPRYMDADIKIEMLHSAHCGIVLADHTKMGKTYLARIDTPDYLITDKEVSGFSYDSLRSAVNIVFACDDTQGSAD